MSNGREIAVDPDAGAPVLLAVDIGGTWMRMGAVDASGRWCAVARDRHGAGEAAVPPGPRLAAFLRTLPGRATLRHACVAVAGPVVGGRVAMTNRPWVLDAAQLATELELNAAWIINDLQASACALPALGADDLVPLRGGIGPERGAIAVVAPGTGLGEAFLVAAGERLLPHPSEGGHAEFAPRDARQRALLAWWAQRLPQVEVESFCSGPGLARIHDFLLADGDRAPCASVAELQAAGSDPVPGIVAAALAGDCPQCGEATALWLDLVAAEAGNFALKVMATGGVGLAGGMLARLAPLIDTERFCSRFEGAGMLRALLAEMPLARIASVDSPLLGAARYGLQHRA